MTDAEKIAALLEVLEEAQGLLIWAARNLNMEMVKTLAVVEIVGRIAHTIDKVTATPVSGG